jgi:hypothetical protein
MFRNGALLFALVVVRTAAAAPPCHSPSQAALGALDAQLNATADDLTIDRQPVLRRVDAARVRLGAQAAVDDWQAIDAGLSARNDARLLTVSTSAPRSWPR